MNHNSTQSIAIEVRGISVNLENLNESRKRHDEKSNYRFDNLEKKIEIIGNDIAASHEFKRQLLTSVAKMEDSITTLTNLSNQAKGGWWTVCVLATVFSAAGSGLTLWLTQLFKK